MTREHLIAQLENVYYHYRTVQSIQQKMQRYRPSDTYPRTVKVPPFPTTYIKAKDRSKFEELNHGSSNGETETENLFRKKYAPAKPKKPKEKTYEPTGDGRVARVKKLGCFPIGAAFCAIVSTFSAVDMMKDMSDHWDEIGVRTQWIVSGVFWAIVLAFVVAMIVAAMRDNFERSSNVRRLKREFVAASAKYEDDMVNYKDACRRFEPVVEEFMSEYRAWRGIYLRAKQEEERIREQLETDRATGVAMIRQNELMPAQQALAESNSGLVSETYMPVLGELIPLLRTGRADSLKEAINLYEEIQYRERELEQYREAEERRQQAEERRHREEMDFMASRERTRQREVQEQRDAEERRHREDMRQRERMEEERRREERRNAVAQCNSCALNGKCSMRSRRPNCASYRPR